MITPRSYAKQLSKSQNSVTKKLKAYLKDPTENNVHDLRTSIRRMTVTADILPKKMRREKDLKEYISNHEKLLKLNARVRDLDIILSKMSSEKNDPDYSEIVKDLSKSRESELKRIRSFGFSVKDEKGFSLRASDLSGSVIRKRFSKSADKLATKIEGRLPIVVQEPANKLELHKLREDSRRLRYVLELDSGPSTSKLLTVLESWQEVLGRIHDSDILILHFENEKDTPKIGKLLERETSSRNDNYEKFRSIARESPSFRLPN